MIKKLPLAVGFLCTANIAAAAIDIIPENAEIITENFKVVDEVPADSTYQINSVKSAHDNSEKLGTLGNMSVVSGEKDPDSIAYIKTDSGNNFVINDTFMVKCRTNADCIPQIYEHIQIGSGRYFAVTVKDIEEWKQVYEYLKNEPQVASFAPSLDHGLRLDHKK